MTADTYSPSLGVLLMGTGNDSNSWGNNANNSVFLIFEDAIANALTSAVSGGTLDLSTNPPPAAASQVHYAALIFTGALGSAQIVRVPNLQKFWWVQNNTSGAFTLSIETFAGSTAGAPQVIPQNGGWQLVYCDGNGDIVVSPFNSAQVTMPDGSPSAPAYAFADDTASGMYGPSTIVTDGVMNGSTALLTCATSTPFNPSDVNRKIVVAGAGAAGANLVTTVSSYTSPSQVVLTANSQTAVSGATVTFDGLQLGFAAAGSSGGPYTLTYRSGMLVSAIAAIINGGANFAVGDTVFLAGGTPLRNALLTVATESGGVITGLTVTDGGLYASVPANPMAQGATSGSGSGLTVNITWGITGILCTRGGTQVVTRMGATSFGFSLIQSVDGLAAANTIGSANLAAAISSSLPLPKPQGRLTLASNTPVLTGDAVSSTSLFWTPYEGLWTPIHNGTTLVPQQLSGQLTLALTSSLSANNIYDVFLAYNSGAPVIGFGSSWSASGGSITAGSCARGTGAGSTALARFLGLWTNANSMSLTYNTGGGNVTITVPANQGFYLGSIFIDSTAGQLTDHLSWGQNRKKGVWNCFNRVPLVLQGGDNTSSWAYVTATIRPANNAAANVLTSFTGLAEEEIAALYQDYLSMSGTTTTCGGQVGVGWNNAAAFSGTQGNAGFSTSGPTINAAATPAGYYTAPPSLGINNIYALETVNAGASNGFNGHGTQGNMLLQATWRG